MAMPGVIKPDEEEVLEANRAFYEALGSLDLARMDAVWLRADWVRCLHPGWELLVGWEEVRTSWADIFRSTTRMLISISRPLVHVAGDTAWVSCLQNVTSAHLEGLATAVIEATNIFVRRQGRWLMVHHHTTPLPGQVPAGASNTVQ
jgi:ketosteroid isomerase-like protein